MPVVWNTAQVRNCNGCEKSQMVEIRSFTKKEGIHILKVPIAASRLVMEELNRCSPSNSSWKANGGTSNRLPIMTVVMVKVVITKGEEAKSNPTV